MRIPARGIALDHPADWPSGLVALPGNKDQRGSMRKRNHLIAKAVSALVALMLPDAALAAEPPTNRTDELEVKPILDARLRSEMVETEPLEATAVTLRLRAGAIASLGRFALLAEGEGTLSGIDDYNAFPFASADSQRRPQYAVVADPQNIELNRLQLQYTSDLAVLTAGRQRINLDDQRWVGSVGWRQNEQTFDALRAEAKLGKTKLDVSYGISQRTIFGQDAGPRTAFDGRFVFAGIGSKVGPVEGKLFSYLIDYEEDFLLANSSQTYGAILSTVVPVGQSVRLSLRASHAQQSDYGENPLEYAADYWSFEGATQLAGFNVAAGWEQLGSDDGRAVQTPLATLHKFNGWADLFLTTPSGGLEDFQISLGKTFKGVKALPGLSANLTFHQFDSAEGDVEYGTEWDASAGVKLGKVALLVKYANYRAEAFGSNTRKLWLQAEWSW
jgi:hypothetical protein